MSTAFNICVFGGAGSNPVDEQDAYILGEFLARKGATLYTGGSKKGIMGHVTSGAKAGLGTVFGVLPERILALGNGHPLQVTVPVKDMHERKRLFWDKCQAFLCLPGGIGTMDELWEVAALVKLGYKPKTTPIVVFDRNGFYKPVRDMINLMVNNGYIKESAKDIIRFTSSIQWTIDELFNASKDSTVIDIETTF